VYDHSRQLNDLEKATTQAQAALDMTPTSDQGKRALRLNNLASRYSDWFDRTSDTQYLKKAIECLEFAIKILAENHPNHSTFVYSLGTAFSKLYGRCGQLGDLQKAIAHLQTSVDSTPDDHPRLRQRMTNLGIAYSDSFKRTDKVDHLQRAIEYIGKAVASTSPHHPGLAGRLVSLGTVFSLKYERFAILEDLETALRHTERALEVLPDGHDHPEYAQYLTNLSYMLSLKYARLGELGDLEKSIDHIRRAIDATEESHPKMGVRLTQLSNVLSDRFDRTGNVEDLNQAILNLERAVETTPDDHPALPTRLNDLGIQLHDRYTRLGRHDDLENALSVTRRAISFNPPDSDRLSAMLNNLVGGLLTKHEHAQEDAERNSSLEEAITNAKRAVDITPKSHPKIALRLCNLALVHRARYELGGKVEDLNEAATALQRAVDMTPPEHPDIALFLNNFGQVLLERFNLTGSNDDKTLAMKLFSRTFDTSAALPLRRMKAARKLMKYLVDKGNWKEAAVIAERAMELLPLLCSRYLSREDQQHAVSQTARFAADACSILLRANSDPSRALEVLEHGRGLIIDYLMDGRGDLSELQAADAEKAERLESLRHKAFMPVPTDVSSDVRQAFSREREMATVALERCLDEIRSLEGFQRFLLPPLARDLQMAAGDGPIAVVNVTPISSDALVVLESGIEHVQLPNLSSSELAMYRPWSLARGATRNTIQVERITDDEDDEFSALMQNLWTNCVRLVLEKLRLSNPQDKRQRTRVWWVGTGLASSLPFHAAGDHSVGSCSNTMSYVISSYTPTIRALKHARQRKTGAMEKHSILLVSMPDTPGFKRLPGAELEEKYIDSVVKEPYSMKPLRHANVAEVLDTMKDFSVAHFACHGSADLIDPSQSYLALRRSDKTDVDKLTVQMISDTDLGKAWLAYLSACSTAQVRVSDLADEALHLASSFQVAGFKHVVASMWPSDDAICARVAKLFYQNLLTGDGVGLGNKAVPLMLDMAVEAIRLEHRNQPYLWAQFIHSGA
jgi:tetratricopeptide (TPR) repeat protein